MIKRFVNRQRAAQLRKRADRLEVQNEKLYVRYEETGDPVRLQIADACTDTIAKVRDLADRLERESS